MGLELLLTCLFIVFGRVADVTLGTMRTISVVRGRKHVAAMLGFVEVFIWIFVVAKVVTGLSENLVFGISYAAGFAIGNYLGITVDEWLGFGDQAFLVISRKGQQMAKRLREEGWILTEIPGQGRDGPTSVLMVIVARKTARQLQDEIESIDPDCFYTVEDIRRASSVAARASQSKGLLASFGGK